MDKEKVSRIYQDNRAFMFGVAFNALSYSVEDAEDAVQDAAIKMMRQKKDPPSSQERGLAFTMTKYAAGDIKDAQQAGCRDVGKTEPLDVDNPLHDKRTAPSAEHEAIIDMEYKRVVSQTPPVVLFNAAGFTARELAERSGRPQKTIESDIHNWRVIFGRSLRNE